MGVRGKRRGEFETHQSPPVDRASRVVSRPLAWSASLAILALSLGWPLLFLIP